MEIGSSRKGNVQVGREEPRHENAVDVVDDVGAHEDERSREEGKENSAGWGGNCVG